MTRGACLLLILPSSRERTLRPAQTHEALLGVRGDRELASCARSCSDGDALDLDQSDLAPHDPGTDHLDAGA
jgi:hypothetical protein